MKTSSDGVILIQEEEGLRLQSYLCPAGVWTVGFGHTSAAGQPLVKPGMTITKEQARTILLNDLLKFEEGVKNLVRVPLTQGQFDALVSFAFNCGLGTPKGHKLGPSGLAGSTLLKRVNAGEYDKVPTEFMKWTKGGGKQLPGLVRRRHREIALWNNLLDKPANAPVRVVPDLPVASKTMSQTREGNGAVVAGALAAMGAANDAVTQVTSAGNGLSAFLDLVKSPNFLVMFGIACIAGAIWYWRKQRLQEEGA